MSHPLGQGTREHNNNSDPTPILRILRTPQSGSCPKPPQSYHGINAAIDIELSETRADDAVSGFDVLSVLAQSSTECTHHWPIACFESHGHILSAAVVLPKVGTFHSVLLEPGGPKEQRGRSGGKMPEDSTRPTASPRIRKPLMVATKT